MVYFYNISINTLLTLQYLKREIYGIKYGAKTTLTIKGI